jgi:hypothetical protein
MSTEPKQEPDVCAVCLAPVEPVTKCMRNHFIHTACAMDMLRLQGRNACPLCTAPLELPPLPPQSPACVVEHAVHVMLAYSCLLFGDAGTRELKQEGLRALQMAKSALHSRVSLWGDSSADLTAIRLFSCQMIVFWVVGLYSGFMMLECILPKFLELQLAFFQNLAQFGLGLQFSEPFPCPCDPTDRCVHLLNTTQVWGKIAAKVAEVLSF